MAFFYVDTATSASSPYFIQYTQLGGREYLFTFHWNSRAGAWYVDLADQDGSMIAAGVRLVCGSILFSGVIDSRMWPGDLFCVPRTQDVSDPGRNDLGSRVMLVYNDLQPIPGVT